jgi:predicted aspartyl protease
MTATMGKVVVSAKLENLNDALNAENGLRPRDQVRSIEVADCLVDTGTTMLGAPPAVIAALGLTKFRSRQSQNTSGLRQVDIYGPVRLFVQGRECNVDVAEVAAGCPVLIGLVPLELMDFVVDPNSQRLIGNPAHGGVEMIDMF